MGGRLAGKVAVVTGGASGIGLATVERFAAEGARVVIADYSGQQDAVAARLGDMTAACHVDVTSSGDIQRLFALTEQRFGRLDVLVNNAGADGEYVPVTESSDENFGRVLDVNVRSVLLGIKYGIPLMLKTGGGSIVNTASCAALQAVPGLATYAASKAAILGLTRTVAAEYATQGIRINTICPGPTDTPMLRELLTPEGLAHMYDIVPMRRLGLPSEVASVALFFASDDSSFVTGTSIPVDGGQVA